MSRHQWCFTKKELENSPSRRDGISAAKECQLRSDYCSHIATTCEALNLSRYTKAAVMILCHRFYARRSHAKCCHHTIASACVFLAAKAHDTPRSLRHVVDVVYGPEIHEKVNETMMTRYNNTNFSADRATRVRYAKARERTLRNEKAGLVLKAERVVLQALGFDLDVELSYKAAVAAWDRLGGYVSSVEFDRLGGAVWGLVAEWVKTTVCLRFGAKCVGVGSVVMAARVLGVKLPKEEEWVVDELGVSLEELKEVVCCMGSKIVMKESHDRD